MKLIKFKMYSGLISGIICTLIGAYLIMYPAKKQAADSFFLIGLISEAYGVILFALHKRINR